MFVTASIGIALSTPRHASPESLLRDADLAMYRAKRRQGALEVFDASMDTRAVERLELETDLRARARARRVPPVYQPIVQLSTAESSKSKRWCAGTTRSAACSRPTSSFRSPRRPA